MSKIERMVLVDGSWLVFRAFFAIPPNFTTKSGLHTNAIFGFATMFRKLLSGRKPECGAVVFDAPDPTHREAKFPAYKAQRPEMPTELAEQLGWIDQLVEAHHFRALRLPGYEADDLIGTLTRQAVAAGMEVIIVAGDKDFAQLISDRVRMMDTLRDVTYDPELVQKKWGVLPAQIADLLALMGDSVDNIPGVPGIGQKGAAALLAKYGSLDGVLAHAAELGGRQRASLDEHREAVKLWRELATIDQQVPLPVALEDLRLLPPDPARLNAVYKELEFFSLLTKDPGAAEQSGEEVSIAIYSDGAAAEAALAALPPGAPVAVVPLWDPPDQVAAGTLVGLALAATPGQAMYLPVAALDGARAWLEDPQHKKTAHDVKPLHMLCLRHGITLRGADLDTRLASFLIEPTKCVPHQLDQVAKEYLQCSVQPLKALIGSGQKQRSLSEVPVAEAARHGAHLADVIVRLGPVLEARLMKEGQAAHFEKYELPLAPVLARMELAGILVDRDDLMRMGAEFAARKAEIESTIYALAGREFNIGSQKQLADVLFEELKLPVIKKTKTGYSTDADVLERLAPRHAIARHILLQRELAKLINTYTDVLREAISPETGRIHASFQQTVSVSGRLVSTDPDLQRTPVRTPQGKRIRRAFIAPPGHALISADWSQIELRVLAHFSRDERLVEAFRDKLDVHRRTAAELFGVAPEAVTPEQRSAGKTVNFATIYGQGATALGQILGIPRKEAQTYIDSYFRHYAGVRAWLDRTISEALACGYVTTLLGRRRYIPELSSRSEMDRQAGQRIAANTPIQGSAADLCKLAMLLIAERLPQQAPRTRMLLQVHDELVFETPMEEVEAARDLIQGVMERPYPLDVPLVVGIGVGQSWGEAH